MNGRHDYSIFLSFKHLDATGIPTRDSALAAELYRFLSSRGLRVFYSPASLEKLGESAFKRAIDNALDAAQVLVAVGTCSENLDARWVRYEWDSFFNDILSSKKPKGRLFTYIEGTDPASLPRTLRQNQVFVHGDGTFEQLLNFLTNALQDGGATIPERPPARTELEVYLRQKEYLERWRLFRFHRDISISDIYVQTELEQGTSQSPLSRRTFGIKGPPIHEQEILAWISGDVASKNRTCIIVGAAGAGKSTLLRSWSIQLIERLREDSAATPTPIPVYVALRYLPRDGHDKDVIGVEEWGRCLSRTSPVLQGSIAERSFLAAETLAAELSPTAGGPNRLPEWIFLLDGLDEMAPENWPRLWRWAQILPPSTRAVISTRPGIVDNLPGLPRSAQYEVCNFNNDQIGRFIEQWFREDSALVSAFKAQLATRSELRRLAAIPLLLTCLSMDVEVRNNAEFPENLLESDLLARAVEIMLERWDAARENRPAANDRISLGMKVFPRMALRHGFGTVFPYEDLASSVNDCARELGLSLSIAEEFIERVTSAGTVVTGTHEYGYAFAHAVFFDYFFSRGIEEGILT